MYFFIDTVGTEITEVVDTDNTGTTEYYNMDRVITV